jgi:hypothetical protein
MVMTVAIGWISRKIPIHVYSLSDPLFDRFLFAFFLFILQSTCFSLHAAFTACPPALASPKV